MKIILLLLSIFFFQYHHAQKFKKIVFYNVENFFDTINGPNSDEEFLPNSKKKWNSKKYNTKLNHIRDVFTELGKPIIMGFCEIENKSVLEDLVDLDEFKNYKIVHYDSKDARGIDVGLIYNSCNLKHINSGIIRFNLPNQSKPTSRDILFATLNYKKEKLHILVAHWPSRRGGVEASEPKRMTAAQNAKKYIDSVLEYDSNAKIIFMGDLNDTPENRSVKLIEKSLNPMINKDSGKHRGSHQYRGKWDILDHIFVSDGCFEGKRKIEKNSGRICDFDFLFETYKGNIQPFRTYVGSKYLGGYSDHLPVFVEIK